LQSSKSILDPSAILPEILADVAYEKEREEAGLQEVLVDEKLKSLKVELLISSSNLVIN
jgi:hypothetical protein